MNIQNLFSVLNFPLESPRFNPIMYIWSVIEKEIRNLDLQQINAWNQIPQNMLSKHRPIYTKIIALVLMETVCLALGNMLLSAFG